MLWGYHLPFIDSAFNRMWKYIPEAWRLEGSTQDLSCSFGWRRRMVFLVSAGANHTAWGLRLPVPRLLLAPVLPSPFTFSLVLPSVLGITIHFCVPFVAVAITQYGYIYHSDCILFINTFYPPPLWQVGLAIISLSVWICKSQKLLRCCSQPPFGGVCHFDSRTCSPYLIPIFCRFLTLCYDVLQCTACPWSPVLLDRPHPLAILCLGLVLLLRCVATGVFSQGQPFLEFICGHAGSHLSMTVHLAPLTGLLLPKAFTKQVILTFIWVLGICLTPLRYLAVAALWAGSLCFCSCPTHLLCWLRVVQSFQLWSSHIIHPHLSSLNDMSMPLLYVSVR